MIVNHAGPSSVTHSGFAMDIVKKSSHSVQLSCASHTDLNVGHFFKFSCHSERSEACSAGEFPQLC